jgi:alpha-N-arabinofuranosidase
MSRKARITVHPAFPIGEISPRLYGAFLEPIGTMVNGSMYNPKHPTADDKGYRRDYLDALKATGLPAVRLPGGNFVSGWDWKNSIGPVEKRKAQLDTAWYQYYTNEIGHDEYIQWTKMIGAEPMYTINLGTGGMNDALGIVEYTNHRAGSYWADLRRSYGQEEPYGVKIWYLGNEMDGPWQIGSWEKDPRGYGVLCHEVSKGMKWTDPTIETIACVSSSPFLAHYPQWDLEVLQECYETVDYISLHHYHLAPPGDIAALLGGSVFFEEYINTEAALCDFLQTKLRTPKKMLLSFDEYGSRMQPLGGVKPGRGQVWEHSFNPEREYIRHDPDNMQLRMRLNQGGDMLAALTSASTLLVLLRHADRVKIGCMTRGLGALAASDRDHVWKSASYYPFTQLMRYGRGMSLRTAVDCDTYDIPGYAPSHYFQYADREGIGYVECAASFDDAAGELNIFAINRDWEGDTSVELDVSGFAGYDLAEHIQLYSDDLDAANSYANPDAVVPTTNPDAALKDGRISANLRKLSWNVFRLTKKAGA